MNDNMEGYNGYLVPTCKKVYLCSPDLSRITVLNGIRTNTVDFHPMVKSYSELSFDVDRFINIDGELVESNGYELLGPKMYLLLEDIGYFIMETPEQRYDGSTEYKSVVAYSAEKEFEQRDWVGIKINCGTYDSMEYSNTDESNKDLTLNHFALKYVSMWDDEDESLSFLDQILKKVTSKWSIGYVSPKLKKQKLPAIEIDSSNLYAVMTNEVAPRMKCLFVFDYLRFDIRVYHKDDLNVDTGIFLGFRNLENEVDVTVDTDSIFTRFSVQGDNELEFRDVNYGDNTIINLDYFLCDPYMDEALLEKYREWENLRDRYRTQYTEIAKKYDSLLEKRDDLIYRVPSDGSYWTNWTNVNEEGLLNNLEYYNKMLKTLQMSVDTRPLEEQKDANNEYLPKQMTQAYRDFLYELDDAKTLYIGYEGGKFGNVDIDDRTAVQWIPEVQTFSLSVSGSLTIAYSPAIKTVDGGRLISSSAINAYLSYLVANADNTVEGIKNVYSLDEKGQDGLKGIVMAVTEDVEQGNFAERVAEVASLYGGDSDEDALRMIFSPLVSKAQAAGIDASTLGRYISEITLTKNLDEAIEIAYSSGNLDTLLQILIGALTYRKGASLAGYRSFDYSHSIREESDMTDHVWYEALLYEQINMYSGYYTYCEIVEYIIPYIKTAIYNLNKIDDEKEKPYRVINENWELYGREELIGVKKSYEDKMKDLDRYSKAWGEMTEDEIKENGLTYVDDGTGAKYEALAGRIDYRKMKYQMGDEETPGTILYQIHILDEEISDIESQMDDLFALTNEYSIVMKYNVTEDEINSLSLIPESLRDEREQCIFTEKELLIIESLLNDTDYVNSNIFNTSILSTDEKIDREMELMDDAQDKLSEASQPQFKFSVSTDNFFRLPDYAAWAAEFAPDSQGVPIGLLKFIRVGIRDDYSVKLRVIGYRWNPCDVTSDLTFEFSSMITGRSGRSDFTELLDSGNNRGSKNSIRIGTGSAKDDQEYAAAIMELLQRNSVFLKTVQNIAGSTTGGVDASQVEGIVSGYISTINISADSINADRIIGLEAKFEELVAGYIETGYVTADYIATKLLEAEEGNFENLVTKVLTIGEDNITTIANGVITTEKIVAELIKAQGGDFDTLSANIINAAQATIESIAAGQVSANLINALNVNADNIFSSNVFTQKLNAWTTNVIGPAYLKDIIAQNITVGDLKAGDIIVTDSMRIITESNGIIMNGSTLQIYGKDEDNNDYVAVQLGYDTTNDASLIIRNANDQIVITPQGITEHAIADGLIVNDMVHERGLQLDRLEYDVVVANEQGGIDILNVYDGDKSFGRIWNSFKNEVHSELASLASTMTGTLIWIKYADSNTPSVMYDEPDGHSYIGIAYNKKSNDKSNNYLDYEWIPFDGDNLTLVDVQQIYYLSNSDNSDDIPEPFVSENIINVSEGGVNTNQGVIGEIELSEGWSITKPDYVDDTYLWTCLVLTYSNGAKQYTNLSLYPGWRKEKLQIGGTQLIRHSKDLIDKERIYWVYD